LQQKATKKKPTALDRARLNIRLQMPELLDVLLLDRTRSREGKPHNIIWATDNYVDLDSEAYAPKAQITPGLITGEHSNLVMSRALKTSDLQKERTRTKAEVFTPTWIVKKQNDAVDAEYEKDDLKTYVRRKWLEITCGEAPYMATRYDMETGAPVPLAERCGFVDRKLARISAEVSDKAEWQRLVELAYQASYGFEWNGDSLLLARENLLYTYCDYYRARWRSKPQRILMEEIATIISFNLFQMDGLTYTIPLSESRQKKSNFRQPLLIDLPPPDDPQLSLLSNSQTDDEWETIVGEKAGVMNWNTYEMIPFESLTRTNPGWLSV